MSRLQTIHLTSLRNAFLECDCIKDPSSRAILLSRLKEQYSAIVVEANNVNQLVLKLIIKCQNYEGSLIYLIQEMNQLFEQESTQIIKLRQTYAQIFSSPPLNARLKLEGDTLVVFNVLEDIKHYIPNQFSEISQDKIREAKSILNTWKKVHTLCEKLVRDYMNVYKYIITEQVDIAKKNIEAFRNICREFAINLNNLDRKVFSFQQIDCLLIIPHCIDPLIETINYPPQNTYFKLGQELAERINDLLFEALRLADRILQEHFNQMAR